MLKIMGEFESLTPKLFNLPLRSKKGGNETWDDFEEKVWKERAEYTSDGFVYISGVKFRLSIAMAAAYLNMKIPGEGNAKYNKLFAGCVMVMNGITTKVHKNDLEYKAVFTAPRKGDGKRWILFPVVKEWNGDLTFNILDEKITEEVFRKVVDYAGMAIGIGAWRPERRGEAGRFECLGMATEVI